MKDILKKFAKWLADKTGVIDDLQKEAQRRNIIKPGRRVGNTTRLADLYIQHLFTTGSISIEDHYISKREDRRFTDKLLFGIIQTRLRTEHNPDLFAFDWKNLKISLINR